MSMFEKMMSDMLGKALPPEVLQHLTPEGMKALGDKVGAIVEHFNEQQNKIIRQNNAIMAHFGITEDERSSHGIIYSGAGNPGGDEYINGNGCSSGS